MNTRLKALFCFAFLSIVGGGSVSVFVPVYAAHTPIYAAHTPAPILSANQWLPADSYAVCQKEYPGTVYDAATKQCICPKWDPHGWNPNYDACPFVDEDCHKKYGFYSRADGFSSCACNTWYTLQDRGWTIECVKNNPFAPDIEQQKNTRLSSLANNYGALNFFGWVLFGILAVWRYRWATAKEETE